MSNSDEQNILKLLPPKQHNSPSSKRTQSVSLAVLEEWRKSHWYGGKNGSLGYRDY
jgi:hypothetical protein